MSGFEVPFAIAGVIVGLLLRAGREHEAKMLGIRIGILIGRGQASRSSGPPPPPPPGPKDPPRPPLHRPVR